VFLLITGVREAVRFLARRAAAAAA